jgi:restriction endonuclease S subunit
VHGSIGVVGPDCEDAVVSKEFYVLRIKDNQRAKVLPEFVVALLRSPRMRVIIEGTVTGTSNRTRIENIDTFLDLPIPQMPKKRVQKRYAKTLHDAFEMQDISTRKLAEVQKDISRDFWKE